MTARAIMATLIAVLLAFPAVTAPGVATAAEKFITLVGTTSTEIYVPASTAILKFDRPPLKAPTRHLPQQTVRNLRTGATLVQVQRDSKSAFGALRSSAGLRAPATGRMGFARVSTYRPHGFAAGFENSAGEFEKL